MSNDKLCPLMSRMVPVQNPLSPGLSLQLAGVPCSRESCGWWSSSLEYYFEPGNGKGVKEKTTGACALVVIAGIQEDQV